MKILTRDELLRTDELPKELVEIPELGGNVYVRVMTVGERGDLEKPAVKAQREGKDLDPAVLKAQMLATCVVDAQGKRIFDVTDIIKIKQLNSRMVERIFAVVARLNGIANEQIEEMAKNSPATAIAGSSSS